VSPLCHLKIDITFKITIEFVKSEEHICRLLKIDNGGGWGRQHLVGRWHRSGGVLNGEPAGYFADENYLV
jgi:hypothetical protein